MREKIERLAKGNFEYEQPTLLVSEDSLTINVTAGEVFCGKFSVYNRDLTVMKGIVYSSDDCLLIPSNQFVGAENEIAYEVHAEYAVPGETYRGELTIVSECGEIKLPFEIRILPMCCISATGEIRDLFQFAGLAQNDWDEAKRIFTSPHFVDTVLVDRIEEQTLYHQLMAGNNPDLAMEEFLVNGKKKGYVQIKADRTSISFAPENRAMMERITIWKDNWGYTDIRVETKGDFFLVSAKRIRTDNFNAGRYVLEVAVDGECLAQGNYYGAVYLKTGRQTIKIDINCTVEKTAREEERKRHVFRETEQKLLCRYLDFRMEKIKPASYIAEAESIVELLLVRLQESIFSENETRHKELQYRIYRTYLAMVSGKHRMAETELQNLRMEQERNGMDEEMTGALYYLEAMRQKDPAAVWNYAERIRELSARNPGSSILLWFRIYTDRRTDKSRQVQLEAIKKNFNLGQTGPLLLYEAAILWNEDPMLLREIGPFERQVISFATRRKILKKEVVLQYSTIAAEKKLRDKVILRNVCFGYEQYAQREVLHALCVLLIENNCREEKYHKYFAQACAAQLKIDRLQQFYMYTCGCSMQTQLENAVLMYFFYGNDLEEPYLSFLYAYVVKNRENYRAYYRNYQKRIETYACEQIRAGHINRNLAVVYSELLHTLPLDSEMATQLPTLIFTYCLECDNKAMVAVSVRHKEEDEEQIVPIEDNIAYIRLYTDDAQIVLMDAENNRYLPAGDCRIYSLLHEEELLEKCYELAGENRYLLLNLLEKIHNYRTVNADSIELSKRVVHLTGLRERFREEELQALVRYCYDSFQPELLDAYLVKQKLEYLSKSDRCTSVELLIVRGRYDLALDAVTKYGTDGLSTKRLLRLCEKVLIQIGDEQNDMLVRLCFNVFRKSQYSERMVRYLAMYFNGTTEEMYHVWEAAKEHSVNTTMLEERLLAQVLFTEVYLAEANRVFLSYCKNKGNGRLIRAYIGNAAFRYFVKGSRIAEEMLPYVFSEAAEGSEICTLARLLYDAEQSELSPKETEFVNANLRMFAAKDKIYPFFSEFNSKAEVPPTMGDKLYVEYHTNPNRRVKISYILDNAEDDDFVTEEMIHVGYGVFVREFILFYGEMLQYYITEETENGPNITESFFRTPDVSKTNDDTTKYGQINLVLTALDLQDDKSSADMLENYYRMEFMMDRLFAPIRE